MRTIAGAAGAILLILIVAVAGLWNLDSLRHANRHLDRIDFEVERHVAEFDRQVAHAESQLQGFERGFEEFDDRLAAAERAWSAHGQEWERALERDWQDEAGAFGRDFKEIAEGLHGHVNSPVWREEWRAFRNEFRRSLRSSLREMKVSLRREFRGMFD